MSSYEPVKLSDYCEITSSKRIYAKEYLNSGVPFYRGKEVVASFAGGSISDPLYISENRYEEIKHKFGAPEQGDLLLTSVGTIGVPYRVTGEFEFYFKDGNLTWFRKLEGIDQDFLYYWLQSPQGKAQLSKCVIGAAQPAYTIERLKGMDIELPPVGAQKDIASVITTYDNLLKNNRRRIQLLEESAHLLYREWFVYLRFPSHEQVKITDGVPHGWTKEPLENLLVLQRGFDLPVSKRVEGEVPIYASTGINGFHNTAKVKGPGVVTGRSGSLGTVMYVAKDFWPLNTALWVKEFKKASPIFTTFLLRAMKLEGYNGGAAVPTLNRNDVHSVDVLCPEQRLMKEFEVEVENIFKQVDKLKEYNEKLAQARDLLLPKLMSGELIV